MGISSNAPVRHLCDWFTGVSRLEISGYGGERLISACASRGIDIKDVKRTAADKLTLCIYTFRLRAFYEEYGKFSPKLSIRELERDGFVLSVSRNKKRWGLAAGFIFSVIIFAMMSSFIWSVEITGTYSVPEGELRSALSLLGIYEGSPVNGHDLTAIQLRIMRDFESIAFITVNITGSTAFVEVTESSLPPKEDSPSPCNIKAARDGVIISIETYQGLSQVKEYQAVSEGKLLVSGVYESKVIGYRLVHASAVIKAYTKRVFEESIPLVSTEYVETGRETKSYYIEFFNIEIKIPFIGEEYEFSDDTYEKTELRAKNKLFPLAFTVCLSKELEETEIIYTPKEAILKARAAVDERMRIALRDCEIIRIKEKADTDGKTLFYSAECAVIEDIAEESEILVSNKKDR